MKGMILETFEKTPQEEAASDILQPIATQLPKFRPFGALSLEMARVRLGYGS